MKLLLNVPEDTVDKISYMIVQRTGKIISERLLRELLRETILRVLNDADAVGTAVQDTCDLQM